MTAAILVLFPVNLKQMRVILAIIQRREETTNIMLIVSPHRLLNAIALKTLENIMTRTITISFSHFYIGLIQSKWSTDTLQSVRTWQGLSESQMAAPQQNICLQQHEEMIPTTHFIPNFNLEFLAEI